MLSAVQNLLPSVLQFNHDSNHSKNLDNGHNGESTHSPTHASSPAENTLVQQQSEAPEGVDELGMRKKRLPTVNETFIIVRPPPAKSNHPLNLQLQLVPPTAPRVTSGSTTHSITSRQSMESMNNPLERIPSIGTNGPPSPPATAGPNRSVTDISLYSTYSTTSLTSNASSGSSVASTTGARRIVPLYNLSAHNVMQNTVLDAGTDAKVAKFSKRGLEILDLGFFELFEVWDSSLSLPIILENPQSKNNSGFRPSTSYKGRSPEPSVVGGLSASASNGSSCSSLPESNTPRVIDFVEPPNLREEKETPRKGARKVFGKLFKKKDAGNAPTPLLQVPRSPAAPALPFKRQPVEQPMMPTSPPPPEQCQQANSSLLPPVLDLQATLIKTTDNTRRPASYVWVVRRWLKRNRGEGLKAMLSAAGDKMSSLPFPGLNMAQDDRLMDYQIRFDWERGDKRKRRGRQTASRQNKRHSVHSAEGAGVGRITSLSEANVRRSGSLNRSSPDRESESNASHAQEEEEFSDPEDSENPWTCTMTLRRLQPLSRKPSEIVNASPTPSHIRPASSGGRLEVAPPSQRPLSMSSNLSTETQENTYSRVKIATIHPTPHHPKIVAQLKVPFPLPDVDICQGYVYRRKGKRSEKESVRKEQCFMLSSEEIKDIICTTAFWLIVREGIGGVGKDKRPGDGWRIRA